MERVVFITKAGQLKYFSDEYKRIYFGNEFCERLIPSVKDLRSVCSFADKKGVSFSLVTPYVTNIGLGKLKLLFEWLKNRKISCEVIINDWGTLRMVNGLYPKLTPVLGRLLTKQKRGPGLKSMLKREESAKFWVVKDPADPKIKKIIFQKKLPLGLDAYYKGSNAASVPIIHDFLAGQRIKRIELDNTEQGLFLELPKNKICASVYLPYVYITTTFFCPTAGCSEKKPSLLKIKPCRNECKRFVFKLRHKSLPKVIFLKGNTQFYKNSVMKIEEWKKMGVDRIVYEPQIPI